MNQKTFNFHYSKNYGSLTRQESWTRVIRLKVAVNMADPTCLLGALSTLKFKSNRRCFMNLFLYIV